MADLRHCRSASAASLTARRDGLFKIGARIVSDDQSIIFLMADVVVSPRLFQQILDAIAALSPLPPARC
jgi:hypothetical protein